MPGFWILDFGLILKSQISKVCPGSGSRSWVASPDFASKSRNSGMLPTVRTNIGKIPVARMSPIVVGKKNRGLRAWARPRASEGPMMICPSKGKI